MTWYPDNQIAYHRLAPIYVQLDQREIYAKHAKQFAQDNNEKTAKYYRIINEVPAVFMIIIVIMVIVKPF